MTTAGNRTWAFTEAKRRAAAMSGAYSIYRHRENVDDYIVRAAQAAHPRPERWRRVATFQADGTQSFTSANDHVPDPIYSDF